MKGSCGPRRVALGVALLTTMAAGVAGAAPARLAREEFAAAVAGLPAVVETFDGFAEGVYASAIPLANGVYAAAGPWVYRVGATNRALGDGTDIAGPRTFSAFPAGTRYWGADVGIDTRAVLTVTVVGMAETVTFDVSADELGGFLGVADPLGLRAVSIVNLGVSNLGVDNVTTAGGVRVEPRPAAQADAPPVPPSAAYTFVPAEDVVDDDEGTGARAEAASTATEAARVHDDALPTAAADAEDDDEDAGAATRATAPASRHATAR